MTPHQRHKRRRQRWIGKRGGRYVPTRNLRAKAWRGRLVQHDGDLAIPPFAWDRQPDVELERSVEEFANEMAARFPSFKGFMDHIDFDAPPAAPPGEER